MVKMDSKEQNLSLGSVTRLEAAGRATHPRVLHFVVVVHDDPEVARPLRRLALLAEVRVDGQVVAHRVLPPLVRSLVEGEVFPGRQTGQRSFRQGVSHSRCAGPETLAGRLGGRPLVRGRASECTALPTLGLLALSGRALCKSSPRPDHRSS